MAQTSNVVRSVLVLVVGVAHCAPIDSITFLTNSAGECARTSAATKSRICDGGLQRVMTSTFKATNVIPQVINVKLKYTGDLVASKHISLVDATLNGNTPCVGAYAAAPADSIHSGALTANADKIATVPQTVKLDATKTYAVCYSGTTNVAGATWADSSIRIKVSKIEYINVYKRKFKTEGTIPNHASLTMEYMGTVLNNRWISFVDATLNSGHPCDKGSIAAAPLDAAHSGSMKALSVKTFTANTAALSGTKLFAVCYTESGGITSSHWRDSGIRIRRSKVTKVQLGVDLKRFGSGFVRDTWNRNTDDYNNIMTDTFPQVPTCSSPMLESWARAKRLRSWMSL